MLLLMTQNSEGARTVLAENDSANQNKQESQTFHNQLNQQLEARQPTQEVYDTSNMLADKDREIERLKLEIGELQDRIIEGRANGEIILSTELFMGMFSASREGGAKYFYLKAEDGIVTGYETDSARSNKNNTQINFNK